MKRLLFMSLLLTAFLLGSKAQMLTVFYMKGDVKCQQKGKTFVLKEKQQVAADAVFILDKGMALILKDDALCRLPVIKGPCKGKLDKLVKKEKANVLERSSEFFSHIAGKGRSEVKDNADRMRQMGSVSRMPSLDGTKPEKIEPPLGPEELMLIKVSDDLDRIINELESDE